MKCVCMSLLSDLIKGWTNRYMILEKFSKGLKKVTGNLFKNEVFLQLRSVRVKSTLCDVRNSPLTNRKTINL